MKARKTEVHGEKLLVVIAGPTATGKTDLAIQLAKYFHTEIVSADSRQIYRELTIGTAKPDAEQLLTVRHHFINSHSVSENFNAGAYAVAARKVIADIFKIHSVVIVAGGSGLYIDALLFGFDELPPSDVSVRQKLKRQMEEYGLDLLVNRLKEADPSSYERIDIRNPQRVIRALEVSISSGKPYSSFLGKNQEPLPWKYILAGICIPRNELYERIEQRTRQMIKLGLKAETEAVSEFRHHNALQTVGYKEMWDHIDGNADLETTQSLIAQHTRNYAKRQLTWFKKYRDMIWIQPGDTGHLVKEISRRTTAG